MKKKAEYEIGCLLIHGFCGNTKEVEHLAAYLEERGFFTLCTKLKGHTGNRRELSRTTYNDWIKSAEDSLIELRKKCEKIIIIGFSMGGLIATNLCTKYKAEIVAFISTPIYLFNFKRIVENLFSRTRIDGEKSFSRKYYKAWTTTPIKVLMNFTCLLIKTRRMFRMLDCPAFVAQGLNDDTVNWKSAGYIFNCVMSKRKSLKHYENSGHLILLGSDKNLLSQDLYEFIIGRKSDK